MDIPDSLKARLEIFKRTGQSAVQQWELFKEPSWFAVLTGQGLVPDAYHPVADVIPEDDLKVRLAKIRAGVDARVKGLPMHNDFIDKNCSAQTIANKTMEKM